MPHATRNPRHWLRLIALGFTLASVADCKHEKKAPLDAVSIDQPHPPDLIAGATPLAMLERTGCYGECPVYRLTVDTTGNVVYVGTRWVKVLGRQEYKLNPSQLAELTGAFERTAFLGLRDYDRVEGTDDDWAHISYQRGGRIKRVRHYHGDTAAPPALTALEDEFDRIVDSGRFVGVPAAGGAQSASPIPAGPTPTPTDSVRPFAPGKSATSPKPSEAAGPPDETVADPDNHP